MARRQFKLPDVGEGLTEAEILRWHVAVGDDVTVNQTLLEVETAKAAVELPSPYEGRVVEVSAEPGATVEVGVVLVTIESDPARAAVEPDGPAEPDRPAAPEPAAAAGAGGSTAGDRTAVLVGYGPRATSAKRRPRRAPGAVAGDGPPPGAAAVSTPVPGGPLGTEEVKPTRHGGLEVGRLTEARRSPHAGPAVPARTIATSEQGEAARIAVLAKPPVRKMAKDLGVDLRTVTPSGPGGTITREDVTTHAGATPAPGGARDDRRVPVKGLRRATATAMVTSAFTAPHVTEFLTVDITRTVDFVESLRGHPDLAGVKVSVLSVVAKAVLLAVPRTPEVNASWAGGNGAGAGAGEQAEIVLHGAVNLGIAVAGPRGLLVPNIADADRLTLPELARALSELTAAAREHRTRPEQLTGGTITISNVGVFGVDAGTPILNPGEAAILAVGAVRARPWVLDGAVVARQVATLALSFDHRIVDGEAGARFLTDVGAILTDPAHALRYA